MIRNGTYVKGEVYEVDDKVLTKLDILEDHPNYYIRDLYDIEPLDGQNNITKAWIYIIKNFKKGVIKSGFLRKLQ
ncbi:hypothetical protein NQ314_002921 [Rhamnusium bicolor]|uniref:Gamma-glutamylcyclotransferase family protein n=1 Tax=Rhamnusium bicolor TaxID=1586634 RepID=A0AAV8ZPN0_9CUCU|nr:hypothetical protein NQ314_002921 [Rhamnusium bicolor]